MAVTRFLLGFFTTLALAGRANGADASFCESAIECLDFTYEKMTSSHCDFDESCVIEVCMILDTTKTNCPKEKGDSFDHICAASDAAGCQYNTTSPNFNDDGKDEERGEECPAEVGVSYSGTGWSTKCEEVSYIKMCQEALPGSKVYFILKDGDDSTTDIFQRGIPGDKCNPFVKCYNGVYECSNDQQTMQERTWEVEVPDICDCNCDETCPETTAPTSQTKSSTSVNGDPHFRTFKGEHFEYHGQCDMVLTKDPNFADGLGLDIQIRTKLVRFWSYVKQAAIRIGDDILEVEGTADALDNENHYWFNFEYQGGRKTYNMNLKKHPVIATLGGFPVTLEVSSPVKRFYTIDLSSKYKGVKILIATYKEFVRTELLGSNEDAFENSVGLFGDFKTGKTLARDGITAIDDFAAYGREWQVLPSESMLFHDVSEPQFPQQCIEPEDPRGDRRRRLDESSVTEEQAEEACAHLKTAMDRKDCVYDILATQDIDMVGAY